MEIDHKHVHIVSMFIWLQQPTWPLRENLTLRLRLTTLARISSVRALRYKP